MKIFGKKTALIMLGISALAVLGIMGVKSSTLSSPVVNNTENSEKSASQDPENTREPVDWEKEQSSIFLKDAAQRDYRDALVVVESIWHGLLDDNDALRDTLANSTDEAEKKIAQSTLEHNMEVVRTGNALGKHFMHLIVTYDLLFEAIEKQNTDDYHRFKARIDVLTAEKNTCIDAYTEAREAQNAHFQQLRNVQ